MINFFKKILKRNGWNPIQYFWLFKNTYTCETEFKGGKKNPIMNSLLHFIDS